MNWRHILERGNRGDLIRARVGNGLKTGLKRATVHRSDAIRVLSSIRSSRFLHRPALNQAWRPQGLLEQFRAGNAHNTSGCLPGSLLALPTALWQPSGRPLAASRTPRQPLQGPESQGIMIPTRCGPEPD